MNHLLRRQHILDENLNMMSIIGSISAVRVESPTKEAISMLYCACCLPRPAYSHRGVMAVGAVAPASGLAFVADTMDLGGGVDNVA
jgi:hypothetical protein